MRRMRLTRVHPTVPPKKPLEQHRQSTSFSLSPERRRWVQDNYERLNYRTPSHLVDDLIRRLMVDSADGREVPKDRRKAGT